MLKLNQNQVRELIEKTLAEDLAGFGDITTKYLLPEGHTSQAYIKCKQQQAVVCGLDLAQWLCQQVDGSISMEKLASEGQTVSRPDQVALLKGSTASLLAAERSALNFIQHLSGIATIARQFADIAAPYGVKVVDTRKTKPGLRLVEKYAVQVGGAYNHRFGLFDGVMLKDNHIKAAGGLTAAVEAIRSRIPHPLKIEVEVQNSDQLQQAVESGADIIMLDNMDTGQIREAVKKIRGEAKPGTLVEVSGNVALDNLESYCQTGIDLISSGYITHSAPAADFSMDFG